MKKLYEKPVAEKIQFDYSAQVVAASGGNDWASDGQGAQVNLFSGMSCQTNILVGCTRYEVP